MLRRFSETLAGDRVIDVLSASVEEVLAGERLAAETEELPSEVKSSELVDAFAAGVKSSSSKSGGDLDSHVLSSVAVALKPLTRQQAADPGMWTWLACGPGREFVWSRWGDGGKFPSNRARLTEVLQSGDIAGRFAMSTFSLNRTSRHALARLWWVCASCEWDIDYAERLIRNQDIFQAIFERRIGMIRGLPLVLADAFRLGTDDPEIRAEYFRGPFARGLNRVSNATRLEALTPEDLSRLVRDVHDETKDDQI